MKPALLLVDLQEDYLRSPSLEPSRGALVERAAALLAGCRRRGVPVVHVRTTVYRDDDHRMEHWKRLGRWRCVAGTPGHAAPAALAPRDGEPVVDKTAFSPFLGGRLDEVLGGLGADLLVVAGVHLHACVRATALDAYQRGFTVWVADDAVGSDDALHAAVTRRYLAERAVEVLPVDAVLAALDGGPRATGFIHLAPADVERPLWRVPVAGPDEVARATAAARAARPAWSAATPAARAALLRRLATLLGRDAAALAAQLALEVGKPIAQGRDEVGRGTALLEAAARRADEALEAPCGPGSRRRRVPVGTIALVTPWNNPLAIPLGKLAPALLYGNAVVWKPAPAGTGIARRVMELLAEAGCPAGLVSLVSGDARTAEAVMADPGVDAVALTGGAAAGRAAQALCARRHLPLQAELGGNNAAIVWSDAADLAGAARLVAEGAFGFAGQRCTANRRVIVEAGCHDRFVDLLRDATAALVLGDPADEATQVGPVISLAARARIAAAIERAAPAASFVVTPHGDAVPPGGAYVAPTIVGCDDAAHEIVQEETFGPVLVVERAADFDHALRLCNGVRHGLVAALFSAAPERRARFLAEAQAGILKLDAATAGADVEAPFGGWKASGVGPPEHGDSNREFYTRTQAVYG